ncbi:MAG TPA: hypothetical protein PLP27_02590 [Crocinitomicaceae bacterium]|nr:hypothetical protein [Crocinitomicaceae bacterium]
MKKHYWFVCVYTLSVMYYKDKTTCTNEIKQYAMTDYSLAEDDAERAKFLFSL